jgi:hypothetical protein
MREIGAPVILAVLKTDERRSGKSALYGGRGELVGLKLKPNVH